VAAVREAQGRHQPRVAPPRIRMFMISLLVGETR
jgi:hypothetical protein